MDRRVLLAVVLMMTVLIVPALFIKRPQTVRRSDGRTVGQVDTARPNPSIGAAPPPAATPPPPRVTGDSLTPPEDTIVVRSPLY